VKRLIRAHLDWVVNNRREARYLFEISRSEWTEDLRDAQRASLNMRGAYLEVMGDLAGSVAVIVAVARPSGSRRRR